MRRPSTVARELRIIGNSCVSIAQEVERGVAHLNDEWDVEFSKHIIERIANTEALLNTAKRAVDDGKRAAMKRRDHKA